MVEIEDNLSNSIPRVEAQDAPGGVVRIQLLDSELTHVEIIAAQRANSPLGQPVPSSGLNKLKVEGEKAFSKFIGKRIDDSLRDPSKDNVDFEINGTRIHVVATEMRRPKLVIPENEVQAGSYERVDVIACVYKQKAGVYFILGYATMEEVLVTSPKHQPDGELKRTIPWTDLHRERIEQVDLSI